MASYNETQPLTLSQLDNCFQLNTNLHLQVNNLKYAYNELLRLYRESNKKSNSSYNSLHDSYMSCLKQKENEPFKKDEMQKYKNKVSFFLTEKNSKSIQSIICS